MLLVSAIAAPISLLADLHQPGRFWHFYAHATPWSWMWLGALLPPCFVGLAVLFGAAWWWGRTGLMRLLGAALALSAVSIRSTPAPRSWCCARGRWHTVFLPVNFALTAWLGALGAMFLVARWLPGGLKALPVDMLRQLSLSAVVLMALGAGLGRAGPAGRGPVVRGRAAPVPRIPDLAHQPGRRGRHGLLHRRPAAKPARALATPLAPGALALTMLAAA